MMTTSRHILIQRCLSGAAIGGVALLLGSCGPSLDDLERACRDEAQINVVDPVLWEEYRAELWKESRDESDRPYPRVRSALSAEGFRRRLVVPMSMADITETNIIFDVVIQIYKEEKTVAFIISKQASLDRFVGPISYDCAVHYPEYHWNNIREYEDGR
ncbi:hypothetical protein KCG44_06640 [Pacificimonas sp. WHA3]|uniref:Lipoprotein n=1 Tax=Pacificimonas pallii TaxID=2827236 RepID=A0ABS6SDG6_9SPHN|nr:hypothetical protein [Pacificimonas pallii]MBV7256462.1 hypothetical protein [Pacificimonas pallii]